MWGYKASNKINQFVLMYNIMCIIFPRIAMQLSPVAKQTLNINGSCSQRLNIVELSLINLATLYCTSSIKPVSQLLCSPPVFPCLNRLEEGGGNRPPPSP